MKKSVFTTLFLLVFTCYGTLNAQTLNEILDKHFKAVGQQKLHDVQSYYVKAKVSQMGMEMPMEMKIKKPDKFLITIEMQGQKIIQAFDGEKGWMIFPMLGPDPQPLEGEQLAQAKQQVNMDSEFYNYKEKGSTAELIGKINMDGNEMYRIKLTTAEGNTRDYFIDAKTFYVSKVKTKVNAQGQDVDVEQLMSNYSTFDGITMPMKIESKTPMGIATVTMEEIKYNLAYDDAIFKQPAK